MAGPPAPRPPELRPPGWDEINEIAAPAQEAVRRYLHMKQAYFELEAARLHAVAAIRALPADVRMACPQLIADWLRELGEAK